MEPREVQKPFWKRWLRMTWRLFVRSPIRFGILIALLGLFDSSAVNLAYGYIIPRIWTDRLGMLLLPLLFAIISAVARGADDSRQTWKVLQEFLHLRFWLKALAAGGVLVIFDLAVHALLIFSDPIAKATYTQRPGALLESFAVQTVLVSQFLGICHAPLSVFWPQLSFRETQNLSQSASTVNGRWQICKLVCGVLAVGIPLEMIPTYGMAEAAWLVFIGTLNYVAYRDIFERQAENLPALVEPVTGHEVMPLTE